MKNVLAAVGVSLIVSCSSTTTPPDVTPQMAGGKMGGGYSVTQLQHGRTLFASRCIECHALPAIAAHSPSDWPRLIDEMADRASLKPAERQAVLAYILAARTYREQ